MTNRRCVVMAVVVLGSASVALAHHSAAMFDQTKTVDVKGVVKSFLWTNPHTLLILTVQGPTGGEDYSFEADGPGYLVRNGWKREGIKPGDVVTVTMNPLHDGGHGGKLVAIRYADGRVLSARISAGAPAARGEGRQ